MMMKIMGMISGLKLNFAFLSAFFFFFFCSLSGTRAF